MAALAAAAFVIAPAAAASPKDQPSSNAPWVIGLLVVVVLAPGLLFLRLRGGMSKRGGGNFRKPE